MDLNQFVAQIKARQWPVQWPGQWVDGKWLAVKKGATLKASHNPNTGEMLMEVTADKESVAAAVAAAFKARSSISAMSLTQRLDVLRRFKESLADFQVPAELALRIEAGKPAWEARHDLDSALKYLDWTCQNGESIHSNLLAPARLGPHKGVAFEMLPIGVTAAYLPFSTPITSFAFYFAASVLAGCPLILSSSSHALLTGMLIGLIAEQQDLPPSLLNVVFGNFSTFKQLLADRRVAAILYTGSREHCDTIRLESRAHVGRQMVLQSGGKNAVVVHSSADLTQAVRCVVYGALKSAGQRCTSTSRVFVYRSLLPQFKEQLLEAFKQVSVGRTDVDSKDDPFMGPLYSDKAVEKYLRFQTMANRESEQTLLWGKVIEGQGKGNFVSPSLHYVSKFDNNGAYQSNVLFSPDVAIYDYDVLDQAIEQINTTDAAFAVSFIGDPEVLKARRHLFLAPNLLVNIPTVEIDATLPLAGRLQSGHHRYHGPGIALYLCYPQVMSHSSEVEDLIKSWPWPGPQ